MVEADSVLLSDNVLHDDEWTSPGTSDTSLLLGSDESTILEKPDIEQPITLSDVFDGLSIPAETLYARYDSRKNASLSNGYWDKKGGMKPISLAHDDLQQKRIFLAYGGSEQYPQPFTFRVRGEHVSFSSGVEPFRFQLAWNIQLHGKEALYHHTDDFIRYMRHCCSHENFDLVAAEVLDELLSKDIPQEEKFDDIVDFIYKYVDDLREIVAHEQNGQFLCDATIYHPVADQVNLEGYRQRFQTSDQTLTGKLLVDLNAQDLMHLRDNLGIDVLLLSGLFPKGELFRKGTGPGSPYSIRHHLQADPNHGSVEDIRKLMSTLESLGMYGMIDFVPNHTAPDSWLLEEDPTLFVHKLVENSHERPPIGSFEYFHNGKRYFIAHGAFDEGGKHAPFSDTAQLDFDNPRTRACLIDLAVEQIKLFGCHSIRLDMTDCVSNEYFRRTWNERYRQENGWPIPEEEDLPEEEFLMEFVAALKEVNPNLGILTESYGKRHTPARAGCNTAINKCDYAPTNGRYRVGFLDAVHSRNATLFSHAIFAHAFDYYQVGGMSGTIGYGNCDEPSLERALGDAAETHALAMRAFIRFMPGSMIIAAGSEVGDDQSQDPVEPQDESSEQPVEERAHSFHRHTEINWNNGDDIIYPVMKIVNELKPSRAGTLTDMSFFEVLPESLPEGAGWCGYHHGHYTALLNPSDHEVPYSFEDKGVMRTGVIQPGSCMFIERKSGRVVFEVEGTNFSVPALSQAA